MSSQNITNFKAIALNDETLRAEAPSVFAAAPMAGVSGRYTFVPTALIVSGLRNLNWVPVAVEEQRIRTESRRGFQKHLIRFRQSNQMETLDEWNVELVLLNSHDAGCAYQLHAGIYRRICSNGLVMADSTFSAMRFRHAGTDTNEVVNGSFRLLEFMPKVGELVGRFKERQLESRECFGLAWNALRLRYGEAALSPVDAETLLKARRSEDEGTDLWRVMNRVCENVIRGGLSDHHRDKRGRLRSVRTLRGIDSKVGVNKGMWALAERVLKGEHLPVEAGLSLVE